MAMGNKVHFQKMWLTEKLQQQAACSSNIIAPLGRGRLKGKRQR